MLLKIKIVIVLIIFHFSLSAMEQWCQFVPVVNGIEYENGPVIELCVAKQSPVFTDMSEDLAVTTEFIPFYLHNCGVETAWLFASCLTKTYAVEQEQSTHAKASLLSQIQGLSPKKKIYICNIAEYAQVRSLADGIYEEIIKGSVDRKLFCLMNPDVKKKMASLLIAQHKCDATLLQTYAEKLRTNEYTIEQEGWLLRPFTYKRRICYFDSNTNTIVGVIKAGKKIKSFYITKLHPLQKWATTLAVLCKKIMGSSEEVIIDVPDNFLIKRILSVDMNTDETCFICRVSTKAYNQENFLINIAQKTITETDQPFFAFEKKDVFSIFLANDYPCYKLCNKLTKNSWYFNGEPYLAKETLLCNKKQIIRKKKKSFGNKPHLKKTIIVNCVDDTMRDFARNISLETLPLVVYTITSHSSGRIALNECEYQEYENIPESCRFMIDAVYVITKEDMLSRGAGVLRSVHRVIFPHIKNFVIWSIGIVPMIIIPIFLSVLVPRISSKEFSEVLQLTLKL